MTRDNYSWDKRHQLLAIAINADQSERAAISYGTAPASSGIEDERISGAFDDALIDSKDDGGSDWLEAEKLVEIASGEALSEIQRRAEMLKDAYPFELVGSSLRYRGSHTGMYEFCLAVTLAPDIKKTPLNRLPMNFELVMSDVVRSYLGEPARSYRTGWPSHDHGERPKKFKALMNRLNELSGEWWWNPEEPNPDDPTHLQAKDEGVDFVVWAPMGDARPGQVFIVGQCACGDDWDTKLNDVEQAKLSKWLRPVTAAAFLRAFTVPRHIPGYHIFRECNTRAGLTFDRARIAMIAESPTNRVFFASRRDMLLLNNDIQLVIPDYEHVSRSA